MTKRSKVFPILRRVFKGKERGIPRTERNWDSSFPSRLPFPFCRVPARNSTFDSWKFCLTSFQNRSSCSHPLLKSTPLLCKSEKEGGSVRKLFSFSSSSWFAIIRVPGLGFLRLNLSKEGAVFTIEEGSVERSRLVSPLANSSSQFRRRLAWNSGEAPSPIFPRFHRYRCLLCPFSSDPEAYFRRENILQGRNIYVFGEFLIFLSLYKWYGKIMIYLEYKILEYNVRWIELLLILPRKINFIPRNEHFSKI